jgi:glycosyltransferase involved in cell wall biosynthesis
VNTIAAIIVSYNRSTLLERAIYSILNQSLKPSVLIIFDNNSTENTLGFLK